jgi:hypothetical protein
MHVEHLEFWIKNDLTSSGEGTVYAKNFSGLAGSEPDATQAFIIACNKKSRTHSTKCIIKCLLFRTIHAKFHGLMISYGLEQNI